MLSEEENGGANCRIWVIKCESSAFGTILSTENSPSANSVAAGEN